MIDLLLLAGVALCALSVIMAVVSVARTQAPRGAAVVLVLGIVALFATVLLDTRPLGVGSLQESWQRVISGQAFGTDTTVTAPPAAVTGDQPPLGAPAESEPVPQTPFQDNTSGENPNAEPAAPGVETPPASQ